MLQAVPPGQLLQAADFRPGSVLFRYVLRGVPRSAATGAAIQAQVKDVFDRPYVPGSSLKGALRTLIFRHAFAASGQKLSPAQLRRSRSWAAQDLERDLLGRDPNHDLLRALHVSDTEAITADHLLLLNAQVFGRRSVGAPIDLECVRGDAVFRATLAIDDYLFQNEAAQRELRFGSQGEWLASLPQLAHEQATQRIRQEVAFYQARPPSRAGSFYRQLATLTRQMPAGSFLLQVGWGGGWDSKTLGYLVPAAEREALIDRYDLARGAHQPGQPFPASRRAIARGTGEEAQPVAPLGWLLVEMKQRLGK
jgi:CRISPR-associated protein Csm5